MTTTKTVVNDELGARIARDAQPTPQPVGRSAEVQAAIDRIAEKVCTRDGLSGEQWNAFTNYLRTLEAQPKPTPSVLTSEDEQGNISGHEVVGCSGGADYVDGFPRVVMLQRLEGGEVITYHHEHSAPKPTPDAVECAREIVIPPIPNGSHMDEVHNEIYEQNVREAAQHITAYGAAVSAEARGKALEEAAILKTALTHACTEIRLCKMQTPHDTKAIEQMVEAFINGAKSYHSKRALKGKAAEGGV